MWQIQQAATAVVAVVVFDGSGACWTTSRHAESCYYETGIVVVATRQQQQHEQEGAVNVAAAFVVVEEMDCPDRNTRTEYSGLVPRNGSYLYGVRHYGIVADDGTDALSIDKCALFIHRRFG